MGWYYYLEDKMAFPFEAKCHREISTSPVQVGDQVTVSGMASEDVCAHSMFVTISYADRKLDVPLAQLSPADEDGDEDTIEAIGDWHYWQNQGYQF